MSDLIIPKSPLEIAMPFAVDIEISSVAEEDIDEALLAKDMEALHYVAALSGFMNKPFIVDSRTALLIPPERDGLDTDAQPLDQVVFEGRFKYYQPVYRHFGEQTIKSLYLAFDDAVTVPFSTLLEGPRLVHARVLDIQDISQVA